MICPFGFRWSFSVQQVIIYFPREPPNIYSLWHLLLMGKEPATPHPFLTGFCDSWSTDSEVRTEHSSFHVEKNILEFQVLESVSRNHQVRPRPSTWSESLHSQNTWIHYSHTFNQLVVVSCYFTVRLKSRRGWKIAHLVEHIPLLWGPGFDLWINMEASGMVLGELHGWWTPLWCLSSMSPPLLDVKIRG